MTHAHNPTLTLLLILALVLTTYISAGVGITSKKDIEKLLQINKIGLIPRNLVALEKVSRSQQRKCQRQRQTNNNEEKTQQLMNTLISTQLANVDTIRYEDDKVDTYETQATRKVSKMIAAQEKMVAGRQRVFWCDEVNNAKDSLSCK